MIEFAEGTELAATTSHAATVPRTPKKSAAAKELDRLGDEIAELAAHVHALTYRLLVRLRAFDACMQEAGGGMGFRSTAEWLSWRTLNDGVTAGAAYG